MQEPISPSEAVYGFAAWLTTRDEAVTLGANHDAAIGAELVDAFCKSQGLDAPREHFDKLLQPYPDR